MIYNLCGGERLAQYVRSVQRSLFADLTPEQVLELTYDVMQYHDVPLDQLAAAGLSRRVRAARDQARVGQAGPNDEDLAGHRHRHPDRRDEQEDARRTTSTAR